MEVKTLDTTESARRSELVTIIKDGLATYYRVGVALREIRDARLYRSTHGDFESFCRGEFDMNRAHAYRLIDSATVVEALSPIGDKVSSSGENLAPIGANVAPENEGQVRALAKAPAEKRGEVWKEAVETAPKVNGKPKVTAKAVRVVVERVKAVADAPAQPDAPAPEPERPAAPDPQPWLAYNAEIDRAAALMKEAGEIADALSAASATKDGVFGGWIERKQYRSFFDSAVAQFNGHKVAGWAPTGKTMPGGRNFVYACEVKVKKGGRK